MAVARLAPSYTWDVATGQSQYTAYRKSEQMFFAKGENELVTKIESMVEEQTNVPRTHGEGLQVVMYQPGGFYREHWDYFSPGWSGNEPVLNRGGQRIVTALMYLNTIESPNGEGATYFPKVDLTIKPVQGTMIVWANVDEQGNIDETTFHEGRPSPTVKWIATVWLRERPFY